MQAQGIARAAIQAGEQVQPFAAHRQQVYVHLLARGLPSRARQSDLGAALLESQVAGDLHEARNIQRQDATRLHQYALGTSHAERDGGARAGGQRLLVRSGEVQHRAICGSAVDPHLQRLARGRDLVHPHQRG